MKKKMVLALLFMSAVGILLMMHNYSHALNLQTPGLWTKYVGNPVLVPTETWEDFIWHAYVMKDDSTYKMWYTSGSPGGNSIGYATSTTGLTWVKYPSNPILTPGSSGEWDDEGVAEPYVLKEDGIYKMWYWGNSGGISQVGYATSLDGLIWIKYAGNPVLTAGNAGSWDEIEAGFPSILHQGNTYKMWYTGQNIAGNYAIGYATSPDGIVWSRHSSNPVLTGTTGTWDEGGLLGGRVFFDGATYTIWYSAGDPCRIGYASSSNGTDWKKYSNNPVLEPGSSGTWDASGVCFPFVILDDGIYKMWYSGSHEGSSGIGYAIAPIMHEIYLPIIIK